MVSPGKAVSVLIDTPVWKDYFRKQEQTFATVNGLMDDGRICCLDLVVAELLQTAKSQKERKVFQDFTRVFPILQEPLAAWQEAAVLSCKLRQKGGPISLRDCYVALMARIHGVLLYTTNKALHRAQEGIGIAFFPERTASR